MLLNRQSNRSLASENRFFIKIVIAASHTDRIQKEDRSSKTV